MDSCSARSSSSSTADCSPRSSTAPVQTAGMSHTSAEDRAIASATQGHSAALLRRPYISWVVAEPNIPSTDPQCGRDTAVSGESDTVRVGSEMVVAVARPGRRLVPIDEPTAGKDEVEPVIDPVLDVVVLAIRCGCVLEVDSVLQQRLVV